MIGRLRSIRLTWPQLALIAASSALATGLIVHVSTHGPRLPYSTLAALRHRVAVHTLASSASAVAAAPAGSAPARSPTITPAADQAPVALNVAPAAPASATGTGGAGTVGAGRDTGGAGGGGAGGGIGGGGIVGGADTNTATSSTTPAASTARASHVFVIALTTPSYRAAFGAGSVAHYLNRTLRRRGTLLSGYRTLGGSELPDYLAMVSGQAPNGDTRGDCPTYAEFAGDTTPLASGQMPGRGCVYPNTVLTIADQVTAAGQQWKAYLAGMGTSTCVHPDSNAADEGALPGAGADYDTRHNPFVYFHSLLDLGGCSSDDVGLQHLAGDLRADKRTPAYAFVAPGACDEPGAGACPGARPGGLVAEDAFLKRWVPAITASPAYKHDGVLIIVFAKAHAGSGSRSGALILSPTARAGATVTSAYTPYSVLRSVEDLLGYTPLAHAGGAHSFAGTALAGA